MGEDIKAQFRKEGDPVFPDTENEDSADSPSVEDEEEKQTDTDPTQSDEGQNSDEEEQGGDKGFADHPRWKEREDQWKERYNSQEQRHQEELRKFREEFDSKIAEVGKSSQPSDPQSNDIPSWFGGDDQQWKEYREHVNTMVQKARDDALESVNSKEQEEQKAIQEATDYMNGQISEIESDPTLNPEGQKIDKNKLLKIVVDNELVDTQGRWNYKAGYRFMKSSSPDNKKDRKKLAGATASENKPETKEKRYKTNEDFSNPNLRPW